MGGWRQGEGPAQLLITFEAERRQTPQQLSAPKYMEKLLVWVESQLADEPGAQYLQRGSGLLGPSYQYSQGNLSRPTLRR